MTRYTRIKVNRRRSNHRRVGSWIRCHAKGTLNKLLADLDMMLDTTNGKLCPEGKASPAEGTLLGTGLFGTRDLRGLPEMSKHTKPKVPMPPPVTYEGAASEKRAQKMDVEKVRKDIATPTPKGPAKAEEPFQVVKSKKGKGKSRAGDQESSSLSVDVPSHSQAAGPASKDSGRGSAQPSPSLNVTSHVPRVVVSDRVYHIPAPRFTPCTEWNPLYDKDYQSRRQKVDSVRNIPSEHGLERLADKEYLESVIKEQLQIAQTKEGTSFPRCRLSELTFFKNELAEVGITLPYDELRILYGYFRPYWAGWIAAYDMESSLLSIAEKPSEECDAALREHCARGHWAKRVAEFRRELGEALAKVDAMTAQARQDILKDAEGQFGTLLAKAPASFTVGMDLEGWIASWDKEDEVEKGTVASQGESGAGGSQLMDAWRAASKLAKEP